MSWERNELSVECLKRNFTVYPYSPGQANVWEFNTWTRGAPADLASWSSCFSPSVLLSLLFCTASSMLWKAALQHRIVAPRASVHAGDALLINGKVLFLDATTFFFCGKKARPKKAKWHWRQLLTAKFSKGVCICVCMHRILSLSPHTGRAGFSAGKSGALKYYNPPFFVSDSILRKR